MRMLKTCFKGVLAPTELRTIALKLWSGMGGGGEGGGLSLPCTATLAQGAGL